MSSLSINGLGFTGLSSGIDTTSLVNGILAIQQAQVQTLQNNVQNVTNQQTAFDAIESDVLDLQTQTEALSQPTNGVFDGRTATPSDSSLVSAAAGSDATPGVYTFTINRLAQANQIASQGFADPAGAIAQGTYQLGVGTGASTAIAVDGSNDTLQGLANAINNSGAAVTAAVINDGAATDPYRLVLTSNETGAANTVNVSFTPAAGGGTQPEFNATSINDAVAAAGNTSTASVTADAGSGAYTGTTNNTYTFTVANGGTVGSGLVTLNYTDSTGANQGSITVNGTGQPQAVAQGLTLAVGPGQLSTGDTFTVNAFVPTVQQAADASITVGTGSGALTVNSASNQVNNLINGVTLSLKAANPNEPVSVTVANNVSAATTAVQNFVTSYNKLITDINSDTSFDATTNTAGPLLGNSDVQSISNEVRSAVTGVVAGLAPQINRLAAVGVTVNGDGTLNLDSNTLSEALNGQLPGVTFAGIKQLFALGGQSTNGGVQFLLGTSKTQASAIPYQVNITQAASQAALTATNALASTVTIDASDNTLVLNVNGTTSNTLTLASGTYTPQQLAQQVQTLANNDSSLGGNNVTVTVNGGKLQIGSEIYGSHSTVSIVGGSALSALGLTGTESGTGQDVAGSFTVNGVTEQATGTGQVLTGNAGNANTDGLAVDVTLTPSQVQAGDNTASLTVTRGIASALDQTLTSLTNPVNGRLANGDAGYKAQITTLNNQIAQDNTLYNAQKNSLLEQFAAMEVKINQLKTEGLVVADFAASVLNNGSSSSSSSNPLGSLGGGSSSSGSGSSGSTSGSSGSSGSSSGS